MRPRRVRLGWDPVDRTIRADDFASMRPRRVRLGWGERNPKLAALAGVASMRPRRVRLGWLLQPNLLGRRQPCFNEAEARTPRMGRPGSRARTAQAGAASMRPRRVRLGWVYVRLQGRS